LTKPAIVLPFVQGRFLKMGGYFQWEERQERVKRKADERASPEETTDGLREEGMNSERVLQNR
jgi:hypothetical protein